MEVCAVGPRLSERALSFNEVVEAVAMPPGDDDFDRFFVANYDRLVRSLTAMTGDAGLATDAVQEAFIKAYSRWSRLCRYENPALWVRRVAINQSRDSFRSALRRRKREDRFHARPGPETTTPDGVEAVDARLDLARVMSELTPRQRSVASLYYIDDLPITEIAATLDLSEGTVKFHLNKARGSLQALLTLEGGDLHG